jgi:hypothetical protein
MTLHYDYWTEHLPSLEISLKKSVAAYSLRYPRIKIGITNNPERCAKEHARNGDWERMIIKYHTTSVHHIKYIELVIINHHLGRVENLVAGGGGPNGEGPYFLYVLVG